MTDSKGCWSGVVSHVLSSRLVARPVWFGEFYWSFEGA